ncbi:MAG: gluconokinase [Acidobacteria bacterium]|nr:gluconokinase [Acidobacteriota bacterium]
MPITLILGLDVGSSSVRGALFDGGGRMLKRTFVKEERRLAATRDGGAELDANKAFQQVVGVIDGVLERAPSGEVTHVAACTFWHSMMGLDERGRPTTPVLGWADNRSREQVAKLRRQLDEAAVHWRTGAHFHSSFWPAKLLWLRAEHKDIWRRTARWCSLGDHLQMHFCGEAASDISIVSGTGILDTRQGIWDAELVRSLKLKPAMLPPIAAGGTAFPLLPKWRKRWPRLADAQWIPAVADGAANSVGSGCAVPGRAALMLGTSGAVRVVLDTPPGSIPEGLWCYRVDARRFILGGAISDGGGLYDRLKQILRIDISDAAIGKEMARRGADAHGLTFMPFLACERSTGYDELRTGEVCGLTMATDAIDILQAAMESVAFRLAEILDRIESVCPVREVITSGGAITASPVWLKMIADILGRDVEVNSEPEASLRGAVLLALEKTGKMEITDWLSAIKTRTISSHPTCHAVYRKARNRHQSVYGSIDNTDK